MTLVDISAQPERHGAKIRSAVAAGDGARSRIAASWHRCASYYGLAPESVVSRRILTERELRDSREQLGSLSDRIFPALSRLSKILSPYNVCTSFATPDGVIVALETFVDDADALRNWGLARGADWSEPREGTNGIGTCLVEETPIAIRHDEHFFLRDTVMTCLAAPVFDHLGQIGGAFNVSLCGSDVDSPARALIASLVLSSTRQIEIDHFHACYANRKIISLPPANGQSGGVLLAVDADGVICGATRAARTQFSLTDARLRSGVCASDVVAPGDDDFGTSERSVIRRELVRTNGNVSAAARNLGVSLATLKRRIARYELRNVFRGE